MRICSFPGCGRKHVGLGLCKGHYSQYRRKGATVPLRDRARRGEFVPCAVDGCQNKRFALGKCSKHYQSSRYDSVKFKHVCSDFTFRRELSARIQRACREGAAPHEAAERFFDEITAKPSLMKALRVMR